MVDAISFIILMLEYNLPETIERYIYNICNNSISRYFRLLKIFFFFNRVDPSTKQTISNSNFDQLVTDPAVRSSWHDVVLAIIRRETTPRVNIHWFSLT